VRKSIIAILVLAAASAGVILIKYYLKNTGNYELKDSDADVEGCNDGVPVENASTEEIDIPVENIPTEETEIKIGMNKTELAKVFGCSATKVSSVIMWAKLTPVAEDTTKTNIPIKTYSVTEVERAMQLREEARRIATNKGLPKFTSIDDYLAFKERKA
jgi:hypothetical protein